MLAAEQQRKGTSMRMFNRVSTGLILTLCLTCRVVAATAVDTIRIDLNPLIDSAAHSQEQFAVNIRRAVSSATQGNWKQNGKLSTWIYTVQIPTAISVSFHASAATLPPSAVLTVSTDQHSVKYSARNVSRSGLWGRPLSGDTVTFSLSVASSEANRVRFHIDSLQAGYRSLGGGIPDHPHYAELKRTAGAAASCTENYSCHVTAGNNGPSHATVAVVVGNLFECTGTLVNDTASDGRPYILTARHCENGQLGGGDPDAAATVSVCHSWCRSVGRSASVGMNLAAGENYYQLTSCTCRRRSPSRSA
jgi:lysyl endopeptidase